MAIVGLLHECAQCGAQWESEADTDDEEDMKDIDNHGGAPDDTD